VIAMLDDGLRRYLDGVPVASRPVMAGRSPAAARASLAAWAGADRPELRAGLEIEDLTFRSGSERLRARRYLPTGGSAPYLMVYFHGGGWVIGDIDSYEDNAVALAKASECEVLSIDYRLAPEHRYPAAVADALNAVDFAYRTIAAGRPIAVAGDSAGGNLAAVCGLRRSAALSGPVAVQLLLYPVVDYDLDRGSYLGPQFGFLSRADMKWFWDNYLPSAEDRADPGASPLRAHSVSAAAPAVIVIGGCDLLRDEDEAYAQRLIEENVEVEVLRYSGAMHGFMSMPRDIPLVRRAWAEAGDGLRRILETAVKGCGANATTSSGQIHG
jgi:acetyl esterase